MAVALAASSTAIGGSGAVTSDSSGLSITLTSAANSLLIVALVFNGNPGTISSVTWNGSAMTQIGTTFSGDATFYVAAFGILNPASGTGTYAATWTNSVTAIRLAAQFSGVLQTSVAAAVTNVVTHTGTTSPASSTITTTNGDGAFWAGATATATAWNTITAGTELKESSSNGVDGMFAYALASGASTTITGSLFNNATWDTMAFDIVQAAGGAAVTPRMTLMGVGP